MVEKRTKKKNRKQKLHYFCDFKIMHFVDTDLMDSAQIIIPLKSQFSHIEITLKCFKTKNWFKKKRNCPRLHKHNY